MKIRLNAEFINSFWEKALIIISIFYPFYNSIFSRIRLLEKVSPFIVLIIIVAALFTGTLRLNSKATLITLFIWIISFINLLMFNVSFNNVICGYLFSMLPLIIVGAAIDIEKNKDFIYIVGD